MISQKKKQYLEEIFTSQLQTEILVKLKTHFGKDFDYYGDRLKKGISIYIPIYRNLPNGFRVVCYPYPVGWHFISADFIPFSTVDPKYLYFARYEVEEIIDKILINNADEIMAVLRLFRLPNLVLECKIFSNRITGSPSLYIVIRRQLSIPERKLKERKADYDFHKFIRDNGDEHHIKKIFKKERLTGNQRMFYKNG